MMLKINKRFRNCSAVPHIWRTKVGGSLCFLLCRLQKMFMKLATIKQYWKKKKKACAGESKFPILFAWLHLRLFQPTLLSLFTSDLQFQLTSNQVYLSCPIGKLKAVCSKWNWFSFPHLFFNSFLPLGMSLTFHSILKLLHLMGFSPFPLHVTSSHSRPSFFLPCCLHPQKAITFDPGSCSTYPGSILSSSFSTLPSVWHF